MKHFTFMLLFLTGIAATAIAQDDPDKDLKKATRDVANYNLDNAANADKLAEALMLVESVVKHSDYQKSAKAWQVYGEAYNAETGRYIRQLVVNPEFQIPDKRAAVKAFKGFANALKYAEKNYESKDALKGIGEIINHMNYLGSLYYQQGDSQLAYENFRAVVEAHKLLEANGELTPFETEKAVNDQIFYAALTGMSSGNMDEAKGMFMQLKDANYENAAIYEALYKIKKDAGDDAGALAVLKEGREKFPDDKGLMFAEINDALAAGNLEELTQKLAIAMEKDPGNISIPTTLGNVHDQLFQQALADTNMETAMQHYAQAKKYYNKALEIDSLHFDAVYSLGALEYNLAAHYSQEMNALADDYSPEGTKKYDAKKAEMMAQFDKALPYFKKAESINSTDLNTMLALREIYARKDQLDVSNQYKEKIEQIQAGGGE